ncbi:adenylyltransferase/cytidyltransferase family protein [Paenibacillus sp. LMG 31461]|uniref:Adenylyltransferase/cytidyltransferase family protein n=1 Tax=Paenibacillus plantarum TaxID=2654975 RepID=A0ABX1X4A1_9BACL|nr:adenylyltransferase/cytidyltransferase family protein [Paenibacillus plantarum]NOU63240.1 adenylyltransferase/cytidyltransferase family protein [Paenibacillus plantarum]
MQKIHMLSEIKKELCSSEDSSRRVVACCGCFDIFHIGHLEYLRGAKELGDVLVVGVNSDESYSRLKKSNPIFCVKDRMSILEAMIYVDYVFSFDEDTFNFSLKHLVPTIFAVGVDKRNLIMCEEEVCKNLNINFTYIGESKRSSSSVIKEIYKD